MFITKAFVEKFRAIENLEFELGNKVTLIAGYNGSMKTTLLGILSQTFTIPRKDHEMSSAKTIDGYSFRSQFGEKFKFNKNEEPGNHKWKLYVNSEVFDREFFEVESIPRNSSGEIRFWSTEGRSEGDGYLVFPVYYLSLKRVSPIGEEKKISQIDELDAEEKQFIAQEQKEIFVSLEENYASSSAKSTTKYFTSSHSAVHDINTISAGQDSLGKILLAVLSFRRLQKNFDSYKGGILLIDEIESTLHPVAQKNLAKKLLKYSRDYKIQFICTTHSPSIIKGCLFENYNKEDTSLIFLKNINNRVENIYNTNLYKITNILDELEGSVTIGTNERKLNVYFEDPVAAQFAKKLLPRRKYAVRQMACSLGAENYINLIKCKVEEFCKSLIILDGDKRRLANKHTNVICLPGVYAPEKFFYNYLHHLPSDDEFWDNSPGGYDKSKCFQEYPDISGVNSIDVYKKWYGSQKAYWGKGQIRFYRNWIKTNTEELENFNKEFEEVYNMLRSNR